MSSDTLIQVLDEVKTHVKSTKEPPFILKESASALRGFTKVNKIEGRVGYDPNSFLNRVKATVTKFLSLIPSTKVKMILNCIMEKHNIEKNETVYSPANFHSYIEVNLAATDVNGMYNKMTGQIFEAIANYNHKGSNWVFKRVISLDIHTVKYEPLRGNSYIPLPDVLQRRRLSSTWRTMMISALSGVLLECEIQLLIIPNESLTS